MRNRSICVYSKTTVCIKVSVLKANNVKNDPLQKKNMTKIGKTVVLKIINS